MIRLKTWQGVILALPVILVVGFILLAAGFQIHAWGINWIWAVFTLIFVGWRFLLVRWTRPVVREIESAIAEVTEELQTTLGDNNLHRNAEETLQEILTLARDDRPLWEDWPTFWNRCQELVSSIAKIYYPDVKYPLLNIYIPQAYGLIRGTVDDTDRFMQNLAPILNQVTIGQAYQAYEVYQKLEPTARKFWRVWNVARWALNPAAAAADTASKGYSDRATQQLLINFNTVLRETALRNLCRQAVLLYSGTISVPEPTLREDKTRTLKDIISRARPVEEVEKEPVNILLAGRTGAGKSSLINTLFREELALVDLLPSTGELQDYRWRTDDGDELILLDSPGYEQVDRPDYREKVLERAEKADIVLLVTPALDPALEADINFLKDLQEDIDNIPVIVCVTGVDRLRPFKEWRPPYDWQTGTRTKEVNIRECIEYRAGLLGELCDYIFPVVNRVENKEEWGIDSLSLALMSSLEPSLQARLARFLNDLEAKTVAAAKIIDRYTLQMATTKGLTEFLKSPVLGFISTLATGSPTLAYLLAEQIPIEQLPSVIGKLQMAYDLFSLFNPEDKKLDLLALWPLLIENSSRPDKNAAAFGNALVEYLTGSLSIEETEKRYREYLKKV